MEEVAPSRSAVHARLGWLAFLAWLLLRFFTPDGGLPLRTPALSGPLVFFYLDASGLALVLALLGWRRSGFDARSGWIATGLHATMLSAQLFLSACERYASGAARAWDLANYVQPMWRAAHGLSMASAVYDGRAVWGDHGAFAMFGFAPFTRVTSSAAIGLFAIQSVLAAASVLTAYGLARALALAPWMALAGAAVLGSSRALAQAARFDFHPECALPVLLLAVAWTFVRGRLVWAIALSLVACTLRDVAAMTLAMLWLYLASGRRRLPLAAAAGCALIAIVDVVWLPAWTGWQSYVAMHGSTSFKPAEALATTLLRSASTFAIGWLHPIAWLAGAPWAVAAAVTPKLIVKGIDYQYGFLFVPVAALGALYSLSALAKKAPRWLEPAALLWTAASVAVNAPLPSRVDVTLDKLAQLDTLVDDMAKLVPPAASVVADACAAPYLIERAQLTLLCRLDGELLQTRGIERWEEPVPNALDAEFVVVRQGCEANGPCARAQLDRAQRQLGYRLIGQAGPFAVLRHPHGARQRDP